MAIKLFLVILIVLVLLLPYRWTRGRTFGGLAGSWQSILYTYTYGPGFEHVELDGLRRLQRWVLLITTTAVGQIQPDVVAWLIEALRQALGL